MQAAPHFLLLAESKRRNRTGDWRFVLQTPEGRRHLEAADAEQAISGERLELLAVVRGLEALEQPSRITLLTPSSYVSRGLSYGLEEWRSNGWQWERYGKMVPVKDGDLWRRLDRALNFHRLECRKLPVELSPASPIDKRTNEPQAEPASPSRVRQWRGWRHAALTAIRIGRETIGRIGLRLAQLGTGLLPRPWLE